MGSRYTQLLISFRTISWQGWDLWTWNRKEYISQYAMGFLIINLRKVFRPITRKDNQGLLRRLEPSQIINDCYEELNCMELNNSQANLGTESLEIKQMNQRNRQHLRGRDFLKRTFAPSICFKIYRNKATTTSS